jgi:hypothetical protein
LPKPKIDPIEPTKYVEPLEPVPSGIEMSADFSMSPLALGLGNTSAAFPVPGQPLMGPIGLAPERIPQLTEAEMLEVLTTSTNTLNRQQQKTSAWNPDALIQAKGYDALDAMKTLAAYYTPVHLLVASILFKQWKVVPKVNGKVVDSATPRYAKAAEIADFIQYACQNIMDTKSGYERQDFREVVGYAVETGIHIGHSVQQIQYRRIQEDGPHRNKFGLQRFIQHPAKSVRFNLDPHTDQIRSLNIYSPIGGYYNELAREKFLVYTFRPQNGLPYGLGLARPCYKHAFAIDTLTRLLGDALQRFGMGFLKATVTNPSQDYIQKVQQLLNQVANGQPLVIPDGLIVELLSLAGGGLDPIEKAIRYHGEQISSHILGQTLTTSTGGSSGSYALASVHQGTQKYFTGFPRRDIEIRFEHQLFTQLVILNYGEEYLDCVPGLDLGVYDHEEAAMVADYVKKYIDGGVLNPNEVFIRGLANFPPFDPSTKMESVLPDRIQERITVAETPDGKAAQTTTSSGGA